MKTFLSYIKCQKGIETLEWILIGALIVAVGIAVYPSTLQPQLIGAVNAVGSTIQAQAGS